MYKSIVRPRLDYGDIIYDQSNNASLSDKNKLVQYNTSLAITVAINGISRIWLWIIKGQKMVMAPVLFT